MAFPPASFVWLSAAALLAVASGVARADPPATRPGPGVSETRPEVEALASASFAERRAAERALVDLAAADPSLREAVGRAAAGHASAEARARAASVLARLDDFDRFSETRISFDLDGTALDAAVVLADLMRGGTGDVGDFDRTAALATYFQGQPEAATVPVRVAVWDVAFWDAVAELGRASGMWPIEHGRRAAGGPIVMPSGVATVGRHPSGAVATQRPAAVRVELQSVQQTRHAAHQLVAGGEGPMRAEAINDNNSLVATLRVLFEPKLNLLPNAAFTVEVSEARGPGGEDLVSRDRTGGIHHAGSRSWLTMMNVQLDPTRAQGLDTLAVLRGEVRAEVAESVAAFEADVAGAAAELARRFADARAAQADPGDADNEMPPSVGPVPVGVEGQAAGFRVRLASLSTPDDENFRRQHQAIDRRRRAADGGQMRNRLRDALRPALRPIVEGEPGEQAVLRVPAMLQFDVDVAADDGDPLAAQALLDGFTVTDGQGNPWQLVNQHAAVDDTHRDAADVSAYPLRLRLIFADWSGSLGSPEQVRWELPVGARTLTVPFEFRDVPLPLQGR